MSNSRERHVKMRLELELKKNTNENSGIVLVIRADRQPPPLSSFTASVPLLQEGEHYVLGIEQIQANVPSNEAREKLLASLSDYEEFQQWVREAVDSNSPISIHKFQLPFEKTRTAHQSYRAERYRGCRIVGHSFGNSRKEGYL